MAWLIRVLHTFQRLRATSRGLDNSPAMLEPKTSQTSIQELEEAEKIIVRNIQHQTYPEEYCNLESSKGPLAKLKPFMKERLLRVGGQLNQSELDYNAKCPMILPGKHRITDMITLYYHLANGHVGLHQVLAESRQHFWIVGGISSVRHVVQRCHECRRWNASVGEQITAPLPAVRVSSDSHQLIYPFAAVGIDYFGPLYVHTGPVTRSARKNPKLHKRYGCIFTCPRYQAMFRQLETDKCPHHRSSLLLARHQDNSHPGLCPN